MGSEYIEFILNSSIVQTISVCIFYLYIFVCAFFFIGWYFKRPYYEVYAYSEELSIANNILAYCSAGAIIIGVASNEGFNVAFAFSYGVCALPAFIFFGIILVLKYLNKLRKHIPEA